MTYEEYRNQLHELQESFLDEYDEHISAGCYGDAENCRKWFDHNAEQLRRAYLEAPE